MQSETAISRELMGKIVDEVFDGAIEDRSVIEEIYAVIKREEAALSKVPEPKPLDLNITQDWFEKRSALEADHEIGAGSRKLTACIDPTPDELAELFKIAHRIPDGWQLVPVAALTAAEPVVAVLEFAKGTPGRENEMPRVLSCNWLPDGRYNVFLNPPDPSVSVNALEWVEENQYLEVWRARPDCGLVFTVEDDGFSASKYRTSVGQKVIGYFNTLIEAKSAAQADYEARIRSALSAQVQDVAGDGRPCSMDEFVSALFSDGADHFDVKDAINEWLRGDWGAALSYLNDDTRSRLIPAAPAKQEGGE